MVTLEDVQAARARTRDRIYLSPCARSETLSKLTGTTALLKLENLQMTGAYKERGALNKLLQLPAAEREQGLIAASAGNHAQAVAYHAGRLGVKATIVMPEATPIMKVANTRAHGARVVLHGANYDEAYAEARRLEHVERLTFVHPFDDPDVIAGQGTVALEILEDAPAIEAIVVCVGGGGLLSGIALTAKALRPEVHVVGVEPEGADCVHRSLKAGRPLVMEKVQTVADGLAAPFAAPLTQAIIERHADDVVLVTDDEILQAMRLILERTKLLVEPAGAAAVAALLTNKAGLAHGTRTVATLSGGNIDVARLKALL
jgi:threonine dehydratase